VTDVTEFNVASEKLYLSPKIYLFNGGSPPTDRPPSLIWNRGMMLSNAFTRLALNEKPILHFDLGWRYR
jgi:putative transposase